MEVIDERGPPETRPENSPVDKLYIYRSVAGPRVDMPGFVWTMDEEDEESTLEISRRVSLGIQHRDLSA